MSGSAGNPVRLSNPFRRITEVGWPARYIAISYGVILTSNIGENEPGGGGPAFVEPHTLAFSQSLDLIALRGTSWVGRSGNWTLTSEAEIGVSGLPFESMNIPFGAGEWNHAGGSGLFPPVQTTNPGAEIGGDVQVPDSGGFFTRDLDLSIDIFAQAIVDGPFDVPFSFPSFPGKWWLCAESTSLVQTVPFDLTGMTATWNGKTYNAIRTSGTTVLFALDEPTA